MLPTTFYGNQKQPLIFEWPIVARVIFLHFFSGWPLVGNEGPSFPTKGQLVLESVVFLQLCFLPHLIVAFVFYKLHCNFLKTQVSQSG